jgi:hypothetical protein
LDHLIFHYNSSRYKNKPKAIAVYTPHTSLDKLECHGFIDFSRTKKNIFYAKVTSTATSTNREFYFEGNTTNINPTTAESYKNALEHQLLCLDI